MQNKVRIFKLWISRSEQEAIPSGFDELGVLRLGHVTGVRQYDHVRVGKVFREPVRGSGTHQYVFAAINRQSGSRNSLGKFPWAVGTGEVRVRFEQATK